MECLTCEGLRGRVTELEDKLTRHKTAIDHDYYGRIITFVMVKAVRRQLATAIEQAPNAKAAADVVISLAAKILIPEDMA